MSKKKKKSAHKSKPSVKVTEEKVLDEVNKTPSSEEAEIKTTEETQAVEETKTENKEAKADKKGKNKAVEVKAKDVNKPKKEKVKKPNKVVRAIKNTGSELKKVTWPKFKDVVKQTGIVLVVVLVFALVIFGLDELCGLLTKLLLK